MVATHSRQRTVPVTCCTKARTISAGSLIGLASTFATTGTTGGLTVTCASACAITSAAGCINAQWKGADTCSNMARLAPLALAISTARSTAALSPDTTTCPAPLSLAAWQTWPCAASAGDRHGRVVVEPEQRRHGADADRHRLLHRLPARAQQPRGVGDGEGAGGGERGIFAERMAGDELRVAFEIETGFGFQHAHRRERNRHQCRLRILGERERIGWALEHDGGKLGAKRFIDLVEHLPGRRKIRRQRLAHADRLAALARKHECDRHTPSQLVFCLN